MDPKESKEIINNFDYLTNAASTTDCTGLIPSLPASEAELDSYNDVYRFYPPRIRSNDSDGEKPMP